MRAFEEQLLRLKQELGLTKDLDVAKALGMSKAAFSNRKRLDSFPEEKVVLLKNEKPALDVLYVLTGQRWTESERVLIDTLAEGAAARGDRELARSVSRVAHNSVTALNDVARDPQVRELLWLLIYCDRKAIEQITLYATKLMGKRPVPFDERGDDPPRLLRAAASEPISDDSAGAKRRVVGGRRADKRR